MGLPRLRAVLADLPAYRAGRPPANPPPGVVAYKLASNENPYPPLPGVLDAIRAAGEQVNRYPSASAGDLEVALGARLGVPADRVVTGAGSVGLLQQLVAAVAADGDEVVFAWRSFEAYPIVVRVGGARPVTVPLLPDARHDLPAMAAAVTARTAMVLVCTPNNPTGPAVHRAELDAFLAAVPDTVLVVLDEAYVEFVRDPDTPDGLDVARGRDNVVVLRTFSKAYGLAGLRIGYAVAAPPVATALRQVTVPFTVTAVGQAAALASLDAETALLARVRELVTERARVRGALRAQGWEVPDAQGNFVWLPAGAATPALAAACERAAVSVRPFGTEGVRVSVGERPANDRVLALAPAFAPESAAARTA